MKISVQDLDESNHSSRLTIVALSLLAEPCEESLAVGGEGSQWCCHLVGFDMVVILTSHAAHEESIVSHRIFQIEAQESEQREINYIDM